MRGLFFLSFIFFNLHEVVIVIHKFPLSLGVQSIQIRQDLYDPLAEVRLEHIPHVVRRAQIRDLIIHEIHRRRVEDLAHLPDRIGPKVPYRSVFIFLDGRLRNPEQFSEFLLGHAFLVSQHLDPCSYQSLFLLEVAKRYRVYSRYILPQSIAKVYWVYFPS